MAPLIYCAKNKKRYPCEISTNRPRCVWFEFPDMLATKMGSTACLPAKLISDKADFMDMLEKFQYFPRNLPSYNDMMTCVAQSADSPPRICEETYDKTGQPCVLCQYIPLIATSPMYRPIKQLCLHPAVEAVVCGDLKKVTENELCIKESKESNESKESDKSDKSSAHSAMLVSFFTSMCILLMSQI